MNSLEHISSEPSAVDSADPSWMPDVLSEPINRFRVSDRVITFCNQAWSNHYGRGLADVVGRCLDDFLSDHELEGLHAQLRLLGPDRPVVVDSVARVDSGETARWVQWVDHYVVTEHGPEIVSVGRDVTDRHLAQRALAESETRFRALADASSDIVWRMRATGSGFDYISPSTMHILGYEPEFFLGDLSSLVEICEPETQRTLGRLLQGERINGRFDLALRHADGHKVILESSMSRSGDSIQGVGRDVTEVRNMQSTLQESASTDALTGLANRRSFDQALDAELDRTAARNASLAVVYIDLDQLKPVNDRFGHEAGDHVLQEAARRLLACADGTDTVARIGGDEFVIIHEVRDDSITRLAERIDERFQRPISVSPTSSVVCSASVGVARAPDDGTTASELVAAADRAMYEAKRERHKHL